ncbi:MAG: PhoU domain-containing protein [Patescibacteria group bacterium]
MFENIKKFWQKEGLLFEAMKSIEKMFIEDKEIFKKATHALMEKIEVKPEEIYQIDQNINQNEIEIRKKILEHLAINPSQDIVFSLILLDVARDTERAGDYSKNIYELSLKYPEEFKKERYTEILKKTRDKILEMFDLTLKAFRESDLVIAQKVMDEHHRLNREMENLIEMIMNTEEIKAKEAVTYALFARFLKRVSAHLGNIATTVINPFHRIRYVKKDGLQDI